MANYDYPRPAVTVDLAIFRVAAKQLELLLIQRSEAPFSRHWALPGGFVHEHQTLESTAKRVLDDKTPLDQLYLEQLATFDAPNRDPRGHVISVAFLGILQSSAESESPGEWFAVDEIPATAFDHDLIVATAVSRLRSKLSYTDLGFGFMPPEFTLTELQKVWEAVLDETLDKRNFRKTMQAHPGVVATGKKTAGGAHPPAATYRFNPTY